MAIVFSMVPILATLALAATYCARQIANGSQPMMDTQRDKPTVVALRELAAGKFGAEILNKAAT